MQRNEVLVGQVFSEKVWLAIKNLNPTKSSGLDGFIGKFFQHYSEVVGEGIIGMVQSFFHLRKLHRALNHTHLVLIPKVAIPRKMA